MAMLVGSHWSMILLHLSVVGWAADSRLFSSLITEIGYNSLKMRKRNRWSLRQCWLMGMPID